MDLEYGLQTEGLILSPDGEVSPYWIKVTNPRYSQAEGHEELFEAR
jgi:hypothetical protein